MSTPLWRSLLGPPHERTADERAIPDFEQHRSRLLGPAKAFTQEAD